MLCFVYEVLNVYAFTCDVLLTFAVLLQNIEALKLHQTVNEENIKCESKFTYLTIENHYFRTQRNWSISLISQFGLGLSLSASTCSELGVATVSWLLFWGTVVGVA